MNLTRRKLLKTLGLASASIIVSSGLNGCDQEEINNPDAPDIQTTFNYGVASGDSLTDRVIIWTRAVPESNEPVHISWEVAEDDAFQTLVNQDNAEVSSATDYTLKVDVTGLLPGRKYYYRFFCNGVYSATGITKTLPDDSVESVKFAAFSCANFPAGFFHTYQAAAERAEQLDAVLHLGDYIYEYDKDGYSDAGTGEELDRVHQPETECLTLEDYRTRYAQYRSDASLQLLHARLPFICVWDDHEIANDTYAEGAENHQENEGDFTERRAQAIQAWYEWLPVRAPVIESDRIKTYRRFDFGNLLSLFMLDTRVIGRDKQLNYLEYYSQEGIFDGITFENDLTDENRTLLGSEQLFWLQGQMQDSVASGIKWQLLGQQVLMGKMYLPGSIIQLDPVTGTPDPQNLLNYQAAAEAYQHLALAVVADLNLVGDLLDYAATITGFNQLSETEQAIALTLAVETNEPERYAQIFAGLAENEQSTLIHYGDLLDSSLNPKIPYNLDAWDGYPVEREIFYATAKSLAANLVVLAGDTHNSWANHLTDKDKNIIGVEFATSSVSSPGMEKYLSIPEGSESTFEAGITQLVDDLHYTNLSQRGYLEITFNSDQVTGEWFYMPRNAEKSAAKPNFEKQQILTSSRDNPGFSLLS